jgi:hypothetical protein
MTTETTPEEDFLAHREELFKEYKNVKNQLDLECNDLDVFLKTLEEKRNVIRTLSTKEDYLKSIINIVLKDEIDPYLAKLQYDHEKQQKDDGYAYDDAPVAKSYKKFDSRHPRTKIGRVFNHLLKTWKV